MALKNELVILKNISKYYDQGNLNLKGFFFNSRSKRTYALKKK